MTRKITRSNLLVAALAAAALTACAATKRSPQAYRADTQQVLESRNAQIKRCYEEQLKQDATAGGTVTLRFVVEKKTGTFTKATVDPSTSKAPDPVLLCVVDAVAGLKLEPPDAAEGQATFTYELRPAPPPM